MKGNNEKILNSILYIIGGAITLLYIVPTIVKEVFNVTNINLLYSFLIVLILYYLSIFLHEFGHVVFGWICGFRFYLMSVGPVMIMKTKDNSLKLFLSQYSWIYGTAALYISDKKYLRNFRIRHFLYTIGGYALNTLCAIFSIYLIFNFNFNNAIIKFSISVFAVLNIGIILLDIAYTNEQSDGYSLYNSLFNKEKDYLASIQYFFSCGIRPHDLSLEDINTNFKDKNWSYSANYHRYYYYLDKGEVDKALEKLYVLATLIDDIKTDDEEGLLLDSAVKMELLYSCFLKKEAEQAKEIFKIIEEKYKEAHPLCKPRALASYEYLITGDIRKAQEIYKKYYQDFDTPFLKGMVMFEYYLAKTHNFVE